MTARLTAAAMEELAAVLRQVYWRQAQLTECFSRRGKRLAAVRTDQADPPLCHYRKERRVDQKWFNTHVDQACDCTRRVVGVQGAKDQVAGERGLNGDFGRFPVTNFPHHDDVRILT